MTRILAVVFLASAGLALGACSGESEHDQLAAAKTSIERKDATGALIQLKNVIQKHPESGEARLLLGKLLLGGGDPAAAAVELSKAEELQVPEEQVVPELARAKLQLGEEAKIVAQYGSLQLKDAAATADLQTSLAVAYATQSDMASAQRASTDRRDQKNRGQPPRDAVLPGRGGTGREELQALAGDHRPYAQDDA